MAKQFEVKTRLTAEDDASPTIGKVDKAFGDLSKTISDRFVITAGDAERAVRALIEVLTSSVRAAAEQEASVSALSAALKNLGPGAENSLGSLLEFAEAQQKITKNSDDAVIATQAMLATFGVAPSKINDATLAAQNLSAAMGTDLRSAAIAVGGTFNGITRGIDRIVPGLKSLSDEALRTGAAVDVMNEALGGRAAAAAETFEGRVIRLENQLNELQETFGNVAVNSEAVAESIDLASTSVSGLNAAMQASGTASGVFTSGIAAAVSPVSALAKVITELPGALNTLISTVAAAATAVGGAFAKAWEDAKKAVEGILNPLTLANDAFQAQAAGISGAASAMDEHTKAVQRALRIDEEWAGTLDNVASLATRLGVTIEADLNAKLEANRIELQFVHDQYRDGIILQRDYHVLVGALAEEEATLRAELTGASDATRDLTEANDGLNRSRSASIPLIQSEIAAQGNLARAVIFTAQAYDYLARTQGRSVATEAAVEAGGRTILKGTRVLLPGGGSRLTSEPGLNSRSFGRFG